MFDDFFWGRVFDKLSVAMLQNYYHVYGGQQFAPYYSAGAGMYHNYYPYYAQFAQSSQSQGFGMQYPQTAQYPYLPQQLGAGVLSLPASVATSTGQNFSPFPPI